MDVRHCNMCAKLPTKDSITYAKHTNVQGKEDSIVNECNVLLYKKKRGSLFLRE